MRPYKKFLAGVGTGILLGAAALSLGMGAEGEKIKPYSVTENTVENHMGRADLRFFERRYFFRDDELSELVMCYTDKGRESMEDCLMFIKKGKYGIEQYVHPVSSCRGCHEEPPKPPEPRRLPVGPDDPVESG